MITIYQRIKELALALYEDDCNIRCQHFSFVFNKSRLVAIGRNSSKTSPWNLLNKKFSTTGEDISGIKGTCSELSACLKIKKTNIPFSKCTLINIRLMKDKTIGLAKPCESCQSLLRYLEFKHVYFSVNENILEKY